VFAVHVRERVLAFSRAAEPGISPARGKDQRGEGGGMNTGSAEFSRLLTVAELRTLSLASLGGALEFYDFIIFCIFYRRDRQTVLSR
jgi:hypothetical protein